MNEQFRKVDFTLMLISKLSSCASLFPSSSAAKYFAVSVRYSVHAISLLIKSTPYTQQRVEQSAVPVGPVDSIHCELGKYMAEL